MPTSPRLTGPQPSQPASFNDVYARELRALRPRIFGRPDATPPGTGGASGGDPRHNGGGGGDPKELAELFARVGTRLTEDPTRWNPDEAPLAALCLSGGGIRSATFNLGMLQGLARAGLLQQFDYLSSVSGGGFVAGWLKAWMFRDGTERVIEQLRATSAPPAAGSNGSRTAQARSSPRVDPLHPEPKPLDQLRHYSNYLTPRVGIFSPDSWAVAALAVRNLMLNWLVIVPVLAVAVGIPQVALVVMREIRRTPPSWLNEAGAILGLLSVVAGLVASFAVHRFRRGSLEASGNAPRGVPEKTVALWAVLPICISAALLSGAALARPWAMWCCSAQSPIVPTILFAAVWTIAIPLIGWVFNRPSHRARREFFAIIGSGLIAGVLLVVLAKWGQDYLGAHPSVYVVVAFPLLLADYLFARALFVGFAGDRGVADPMQRAARETWPGAEAARASLDRADHDREWWARFSGWVMAVAIAWAALAAIAVLAYDALRQVAPAIIAALGGVSGIVAAILGKSGDTPSGHDQGAKVASRAKQWALALAAPTFVVLLLVFLARGNQALADALVPPRQLPLELRLLVLPGLFVGFLAFAALVGAFVNVNRFSLHGLYRNRLVRAYLGASNTGRRPDPFTGFAHNDNLFLHELWCPPGRSSRRPGSTRPLPVINAALNLVTGEKLAWQHRKAESFSMTPFYCGNFHEGYRRSDEYGGEYGISLGTAMAISGAAANPNMGYHSSAAVTFLMTLFNARLGSWLGNTNEHGRSTYRLPGPKWAVKPLFAELLGMTTATSRYVNLSDGGHFDNLGLYEMVLRRCRYILVSDAGRDPKHAFEDLGNAIRKVRIDFGIPIEFEKRIAIPARGEEASSGLFCAVARIRYSAIDETPEDADGWLVYVKPALRARGARNAHDAPVPYDIFSYAQRSQDFPHESTNDQWFDEAQFESYRALGFHITSQLTAAMRGDPTPSFPEFRHSVLDYMGEVTVAVGAAAAAAAGVVGAPSDPAPTDPAAGGPAPGGLSPDLETGLPLVADDSPPAEAPAGHAGHGQLR